MAIDVGGMRAPYKSGFEVFTEDQLSFLEPIKQFEIWFNEANKTPGIMEPNAMCVATATKSGIPSCRMILLKSYGNDGFIFYTNYNSRKGRELIDNPKACLCFYWGELKRSVRIEGCVEKVSEKESTDYFNSRPKPSQIGACVSAQSEVIDSRDILTAKQKELEEIYKDSPVVPKPEHWGGFRVIPHFVEFWQGQTNRVHDRIIYRRKHFEEGNTTQPATDDDWVIERLAP